MVGVLEHVQSVGRVCVCVCVGSGFWSIRSRSLVYRLCERVVYWCSYLQCCWDGCLCTANKGLVGDAE